MKSNEEIKNLFHDFEPEVDDDRIDESWKRIKYFVPQKKQKKRAIFFWFSGAALLLLIGSAIIATDVLNKRENSLPSLSPITVDKHSNNTVASNEISAPSKEHSSIKAVSKNSTLKNNNIRKETSLPGHTGSLKALSSKTISSLSSEKITFVNHAVSEYPDSSSKIASLENFEFLNAFPFSVLPDTSLKPSSERVRAFVRKKYISLEMIGGYQYSTLYVSFPDIRIPKESVSGHGWIAGLGLNYQLKNKLGVTLFLMAGKTNQEFKSLSSQNFILPKIPVVTSSMPDTTRYKIAGTTDYIRTGFAYSAGLGLDYRLFEKSRLSLNTFVLLNAVYSSYHYGFKKDLGNETFIYIAGKPDSPHTNKAPSGFKDEEFEVQNALWTAGLTGGITAGYALTPKADLILKPAYQYGLSEERLKSNSRIFDLKRNNFLMNLGIRISL